MLTDTFGGTPIHIGQQSGGNTPVGEVLIPDEFQKYQKVEHNSDSIEESYRELSTTQ